MWKYSNLVNVSILLIIACNNNSNLNDKSLIADELVSGSSISLFNEWKLQKFGTTGKEQEILLDTKITLKFEQEFPIVFTGFGGCNDYKGIFTVQEGIHRIENLVATIEECSQEEILEQEQEFLNLLEATRTLEIDSQEGQLHMFDEGKEQTLHFSLITQILEELPLTNTVWELNYFETIDEFATATNVIPGSSITLQFDEDGQISGFNGCHEYTGSYQITNESTMTIGSLSATGSACSDSALALQESNYTGRLGNTVLFEHIQNTLRLYEKDKKKSLYFIGRENN